ncbi:MAG: permease-like cell division protein FtsX [Alistipes sp.]|nr:permease-like cell division protein FtsX [Alistipes sp.]
MKEDKRLKRKVRNSYIVSTISMALVLFLLGSVGYLMLAAMQVADTLQNSIVVMVELKRGTPTEQADSLGRCLQEEGLVSAVQFVSKEQKVEDEEFRRVFASSFEEVLGENPLLDSFDVTLTAASENQTAVEQYVARVEQMAEVDCVSFPAQMADRLHRTVGKIRLVLILFGGALLLISLVLLNNTIRLAIFSKRYVINTMKLVGATKWFIMRPFLWSAIRQGIASGVLAAVLFAVAVYGLVEAVPELSTLADLERVAVLLGVLIGVGVLLSLLFTGFAINKFVNMKSNKIYLY